MQFKRINNDREFNKLEDKDRVLDLMLKACVEEDRLRYEMTGRPSDANKNMILSTVTNTLRVQGSALVVAYLNGICVGSGLLQPYDVLSVYSMINIDEQYRGNGIGTKLMSEMDKVSKLLGYQGSSLMVMENNKARNLYQRLGYKTEQSYMVNLYY